MVVLALQVLNKRNNGAGLRHCLPDTRARLNGQSNGRSRSRPVLLERAPVERPVYGKKIHHPKQEKIVGPHLEIDLKKVNSVSI